MLVPLGKKKYAWGSTAIALYSDSIVNKYKLNESNYEDKLMKEWYVKSILVGGWHEEKQIGKIYLCCVFQIKISVQRIK